MVSMRKGRKVRVKQVAEGEGCCVLVHPEKYNIMTRTFSKGKGIEMLLSPEEIMNNKSSGTGIFGKKFDKFLDKHGVKKIAYKVGDLAKPLVKNALRGLSASAIASNPELAPLIAFAEQHGEKFLDKPSDYGVGKGLYASGPSGRGLETDYTYRSSSTNAGGPRAPGSATLAGMVAENNRLNSLNNETGNNYGVRSKSAIEHAVANRARELNTNKMIEARENILSTGDGLYSGSGMSGCGHTPSHRREMGSVGRGGNLLRNQGILPPAMRSISQSANFLRQVQSPPQLQKYYRSGE